MITSCERARKFVPKNDVRVCVHFCLRPLVPLERCDDGIQMNVSRKLMSVSLIRTKNPEFYLLDKIKESDFGRHKE